MLKMITISLALITPGVAPAAARALSNLYLSQMDR